MNFKLHTLSYSKLFLLDAMGAFMTAVLPIIISWLIPGFFGIPNDIIQSTSWLAIGYACYSFICSQCVENRAHPWLYIIIVLNFLYCCLIGVVMHYFRNDMSTWGKIYFAIEILIILFVVGVEWKAARR